MSDPEDEPIEVVPLGNGRYQVARGMTRRLAFAVAGRDTWVFLDGRAYRVRDQPERARRAHGEAEETVTAPMPATVLAIHAAPGQRVERNEVVILLEAMKMELPIRAPRDGVVKRLGCAVGDMVQAGGVLMEMERE